MLERLIEIDKILFHFVNDTLSNDFFDVVLPFFRNSTNWIPLYILLVYLSYRKNGLKPTLIFLVLAGITIFISDFLLANQIKHAVERLRPCNNPSIQVHLLLKHCGSGFSFVSAHACNHFAIAGISTIILKLYSKKFIPIAYIWAAIISFAQVYVGVHFPIDILCGALLGILTGWISATYIHPFLSKHILK